VASFFRRHRPAYRLSDGFVLPELAVGPLAAGTFRFETSLVIDQYLPVQNCLESTIRRRAFDATMGRIAELNEWAFYELDRWAYLLVDVGPEGVTFSYRCIEPASPQSALQTLYSVGPAGPSCVGASLLIALAPAVWLARVVSFRRRDWGLTAGCAVMSRRPCFPGVGRLGGVGSPRPGRVSPPA